MSAFHVYGTLTIRRGVTGMRHIGSGNWVPLQKQIIVFRVSGTNREDAQEIVNSHVSSLANSVRDEYSYSFQPDPVTMRYSTELR